MFFWFKRLKYPNRTVWACSNCGKKFHWNSKKGSMDYYYFNEFTEKYEKSVFCKWKCFDSFYSECRETPYMKARREIQDISFTYLLNSMEDIINNDLPSK